MRYDVEWRKGGKGGNNQHQTSEDVELELRADLVVCSKTVPWHYQDNNVSRFAFGRCVCRILCLRALVHCSVVVLLVRTVFTCDCLYTCMYYCTLSLSVALPAHYSLSPLAAFSLFFRVRSVHCLASPSRHVRRRLTRRYLAGRPR